MFVLLPFKDKVKRCHSNTARLLNIEKLQEFKVNIRYRNRKNNLDKEVSSGCSYFRSLEVHCLHDVTIAIFLEFLATKSLTYGLLYLNWIGSLQGDRDSGICPRGFSYPTRLLKGDGTCVLTRVLSPESLRWYSRTTSPTINTLDQSFIDQLEWYHWSIVSVSWTSSEWTMSITQFALGCSLLITKFDPEKTLGLILWSQGNSCFTLKAQIFFPEILKPMLGSANYLFYCTFFKITLNIDIIQVIS